MTARKAAAKAAPARKTAAAKKGPTAPQPPKLTAEQRLAHLEAAHAQLRTEHDALAQIIQAAVMAQVQQAILAQPPEQQQALVQQLLNGAQQ